MVPGMLFSIALIGFSKSVQRETPRNFDERVLWEDGLQAAEEVNFSKWRCDLPSFSA
jgi:hypothetical protein